MITNHVCNVPRTIYKIINRDWLVITVVLVQTSYSLYSPATHYVVDTVLNASTDSVHPEDAISYAHLQTRSQERGF